jgi:hypothetical protein
MRSATGEVWRANCGSAAFKALMECKDILRKRCGWRLGQRPVPGRPTGPRNGSKEGAKLTNENAPLEVCFPPPPGHQRTYRTPPQC